MASLPLLLLLAALAHVGAAQTCFHRQDCQDYACPPGKVNPGDLEAMMWYTSRGGDEYRASMNMAGEALMASPGGLHREYPWRYHTTLKYFCCYTPDEMFRLADALAEIAWAPVALRWSHFSCNSFVANRTDVDVLAVLDEDSNTRMQAWIGGIEAALTTAGIPIHKPRSEQTPFHSTLGGVDTSKTNVTELLETINGKLTDGVINRDMITIDWFFLDYPLRLFTASGMDAARRREVEEAFARVQAQRAVHAK